MPTAEYMRQYRARRRAPIAARPCEHCGESFTPARRDARYCGDACRAAARRLRVDVTWRHNPHGWPKGDGLCASLVSGSGCHAVPVWERSKFFHATGLTQTSYWCEEHSGAPPE